MTRNVDGINYHLMLTDTAGQEEYRGMWAASNLRSDAFLLVYDITNAASLEGLDYFSSMLEMEAERRADAGEAPPVAIVAGNKSDLQGARQVRSQQGLEWARARRCGFMETSAREMVNIEETFARECFPTFCTSRGLHQSRSFRFFFPLSSPPPASKAPRPPTTPFPPPQT